jgi:undecaprenyl-phosphate 4-deoxy-4-formamido-L-arabinose transferase
MRSKKHAGSEIWGIAAKVRLFPPILWRGIVFSFAGFVCNNCGPSGIRSFVSERLALRQLRENLSSAEKITPIREPATTPDRTLVSVVVPVYNEAANLPALWTRLEPVMRTCGRPWEVLFVDDGSADQSLELMRQFAASAHGAVRVIELARNFGQHSAILAGFRQCRGQIVVTLDADLQNPPEEIPRLLAAIDEGNDVVGGWREVRHDFAYRRFASNLQNRVTSMIVGVPMHDYGCMLRAYRRHIVDTVVACDEKAAFVPALANSFAKRVAEIPVGHEERQSGSSKYNLFRLAHLSLNLITGFSLMPIQAVSVAGILVFVLDALLVLLLIAHRILYGPQQEGALWTLFALNFLVLGFVLLAVGLIGEYIGRIYLEVRRRPTYIVRAVHGDESDSPERR